MSASRWAFARSRRWLGYLALVLVFSIACILLSRWQLDRREEKVQENARVTANFDRAPIPAGTALPEIGTWSVDREWLPVELHGHYLGDQALLARARPNSGQPGFEQLVPFQDASGRVLIVDRGWIPTGQKQDAPDAVPAIPEGELVVVTRLKPAEPEIPGRSAPAGQIATIHPPAFAGTLGADRVWSAAYGLLATERTATGAPAAGSTGKLTDRPAMDEGNHLSYAVQWVVFALIAAGALALGIRNEYRIRNADDPRVQRAEAKRAARNRNRAPSDADEEDALLDGATP